MERKTKVHAQDGKQEIVITREFDLPLDLLFKAYAEPDIIAQWMGTKVLKLENKKHGSYQFETSDPQGNVVFRANGTFPEFVLNQKITRTFEMENTSVRRSDVRRSEAPAFQFAVLLEFLEFEKLTDDTSKLTMQIVYKSVELRDEMLKLPFAQGLNWAHNRLQEVADKLIKS